MKISIITCQNADNHGARLQCYALQQWLIRQGNDVQIIDYRPSYMRGPQPLLYWPGTSVKNWIKLFVRFHKRLRALKRHQYFEQFSQKYLNRTRKYFSIEELRKDPPISDLYLAGSDQIWNTTFENGTDPGYYLDFGPESVRRESFAASFAIEELVPESIPFVTENLKRFDMITVREQSALRILQKLGFSGVQQEDPAFLLSAEQWDEIADGVGKGENYVLVYDFYLGDDVKGKAQELARKHHLKIYAICHEPLQYADKNFVYAGPCTFVSLVKHARYVVSNSFHGTVFAMIYKVPFVILNRPDGLNVRMRDLLERHPEYSCLKV